ncbi:chorismate mutase [Clostridium beijerinckii]|nr:chorismate mutase [Clostridium beijerinckii]
MAAIDDYRNKIDEIDKEITRLFEERMDIVIKVGEYKNRIIYRFLIKIEKVKLSKKIWGILKIKNMRMKPESFIQK